MDVSRPVVFVLTAFFAAVGVACGPLIIGNEDLDPERFRETIAEAREDGLTVYWLGRELDAGGATFDGIDPSSAQSEDGLIEWIELSYFDDELRGDQEQRRAQGTILLYSMTPEAGANANEIEQPAQFAQIDRKSIEVAGLAGELITSSLSAGQPPTGLKAILTSDDVVVVVSTSAFFDDEGQVNPLMDEELFLDVLQNLRPYDE